MFKCLIGMLKMQVRPTNNALISLDVIITNCDVIPIVMPNFTIQQKFALLNLLFDQYMV